MTWRAGATASRPAVAVVVVCRRRPSRRFPDLFASRADGIFLRVTARNPDFAAQRHDRSSHHHRLGELVLAGVVAEPVVVTLVERFLVRRSSIVSAPGLSCVLTGQFTALRPVTACPSEQWSGWTSSHRLVAAVLRLHLRGEPGRRRRRRTPQPRRSNAKADYQLGGNYALPHGVTVVTRDRTEPPADGCLLHLLRQRVPDATRSAAVVAAPPLELAAARPRPSWSATRAGPAKFCSTRRPRANAGHRERRGGGSRLRARRLRRRRAGQPRLVHPVAPPARPVRQPGAGQAAGGPGSPAGLAIAQKNLAGLTRSRASSYRVRLRRRRGVRGLAGVRLVTERLTGATSSRSSTPTTAVLVHPGLSPATVDTWSVDRLPRPHVRHPVEPRYGYAAC